MKKRIPRKRLKPNQAPELKKLAGLVGEFIEYWGFKAVHGRIWLYLYASREPLSSAELAELAGISAPSVTETVQTLLRYEVIERAPKGPNGAMRYTANPNVARAIGNVLRERESEMLRTIAVAADRARGEAAGRTMAPAQPGWSIDPSRIDEIASWLELFNFLLQTGIASLLRRENPFSEPSRFRRELSEQIGSPISGQPGPEKP